MPARKKPAVKRSPVKRRAVKKKAAAKRKPRVVKPAPLPEPPILLTPSALLEWERVAALTNKSNATIFALYCAAVGRAVDANEAIAYIAGLAPGARGFIIQKGAGGWGENPAVRTAQDADKHAFEFAVRLGLVPAPNAAAGRSGEDGLSQLPGWSDTK